MFTKFFKKQKITTEDLIKFGTISGLLEIVYIVLVAGFFILSESIFNIESKSAILGIIAVLMLLVFSATISAVLIFGIPFYLMITKKYKEAGIVLASSVGAMSLVFALIILGEIFLY